MTSQHIRRAAAALVSAALLASLTVTSVASPASAAKPRCQGKMATIVGTKKADRIIGTAKRDIIVAKGGNDRIYGRGGNDLICAGSGNDVVYGGPGADTIWGQLGNDRLYGNAGPDFLAGQVGNDTINGGIGVDTCFQGTGTGPVARCERPAPPAPAPPAPAPPTPGPSLIPLDGILAVAYSDVNGNHVYDVEDVFISKLVDTSANGTPGPGDTIVMGSYPTNLARSSFGAWGVYEHSVDSVYVGTFRVLATLSSGAEFAWGDQRLVSPDLPPAEFFSERHSIMKQPDSVFQDSHYPGSPGPEAPLDVIRVGADSPSQPQGSEIDLHMTRATDDGFVDVKIPYLSNS